MGRVIVWFVEYCAFLYCDILSQKATKAAHDLTTPPTERLEILKKREAAELIMRSINTERAQRNSKLFKSTSI